MIAELMQLVRSLSVSVCRAVRLLLIVLVTVVRVVEDQPNHQNHSARLVHGSCSFLLWTPHYSLKIPPKRKKRSAPSFGFTADVYNNYPEDLGAALYREPFDFNAEPPWDPS